MKHWVAVYDVCDERRRLKLARTLDDFGCRVQRSVFEITATDAGLELLCRRIYRIIDPAQNTVRFYAQCAACVEKVLDLGMAHEKPFDMPEVIII